MVISAEKKGNEKNIVQADKNEEKSFKKLTDIQPGTTVRVIKIEAGQEAKTRLNHLGITPDVILKLECSAPFHGPVCLKVRGTQLCVGRGLAEKVMVEKVSEPQCDE
jgi:ferrous iron transport protein A